jgi:transposase
VSSPKGSTRSTAASAGGSLCRLDRAAYRRRNVVERCFHKLKHNKALATRYDKRARHYEALVTIACLRIWLP